jgi:hypothetical protein
MSDTEPPSIPAAERDIARERKRFADLDGNDGSLQRDEDQRDDGLITRESAFQRR